MSNYSALLVKKNYANEVGAQALFFSSPHGKAVRVEAPDILKEFTDNAYIGRDPEGVLYYDSEDDLTGTGKNYVVKSQTTSDGTSTTVAHVIFYTSSQASPFAEFIGKDTYSIVLTSGMDNYSSSGEWKELDIGSSVTKVQRASRANTITFTLSAIKKKATITLGVSSSTSSGEAYATSIAQATVDAKGTTWYRDTATLVGGQYASYQEDRVVFYQNDYTGTDFTGYFVPVESSNTSLGVANNNKVFASVAWSDI